MKPFVDQAVLEYLFLNTPHLIVRPVLVGDECVLDVLGTFKYLRHAKWFLQDYLSEFKGNLRDIYLFTVNHNVFKERTQ